MLYRFARTVCRTVLFLFRNWKVIGAGNVPATGGLVVVCNHVSYWDPVAVGCALPRKINFMAKTELFSIPVLGSLIPRLGAYPVRRGQSDRGAIVHSLEILEREEVVGVFPEGTRSKTGKLMEAHTGAVILAYRAKVPILPMAVIGSRKHLGKITVIIGKPILFPQFYDAKPDRSELVDATKVVMGEVSKMLNTSC